MILHKHKLNQSKKSKIIYFINFESINTTYRCITASEAISRAETLSSL